jgi:hypothetical protein
LLAASLVEAIDVENRVERTEDGIGRGCATERCTTKDVVTLSDKSSVAARMVVAAADNLMELQLNERVGENYGGKEATVS